jgi:anti-anti-sigma factor
MPELGQEPGTQRYRELDLYPEDVTHPGIVVLRLDSGLFFATAEALDNRVRDAILDGDGVRAVILDLGGVEFVDSQGAAKLAELNKIAETEGVVLRLARVRPEVEDMLDADGLVATIGENRIHRNVFRAVDAQLAQDTGTESEDERTP